MIGRLKGLVASWLRKRLRHPDMHESLRRLSASGFQPRTVIDVGAYHGDFTAMALSVWPECSAICFEPQPAKKAVLDHRFAADPRVRVVTELLAARSGEAHRLSLVETASSVLEEHETKHEASVDLVSISLQDWHADNPGTSPPTLLKLDVQGYELEVLKGAERLMASIEVIIAEVNLLDIHRQVPLMHEVSSWLAEREFVAFDVAGLTRRPLDLALWQMDLVYVRRNGSFRQDKRWVR